MTYRYVLIIGGEQEGEPLASTEEVRAAIRLYRGMHRKDPLVRRLYRGMHSKDPLVRRIMVGRLVGAGETVHGQGVFSADSFEPGAPNANLDEAYWHQRIRELINAELKPRRHFLWLNVRGGDGNSEIDQIGFLSALSGWLYRLDESSPESQFATGDDWSSTGNKFHWRGGGLEVDLTAIPSRPDTAPLNEIVGNPQPAFAFYTDD